MSATLHESQCDVLIIGAGPAGLMATTWMARCGVEARIIDKRGTKIFNGHADGLQCRSLEIFDSFGMANRILQEANYMLEMCMWNPGPDEKIRRSGRMYDTPPGISRFTEVVLHQGRIERFFLDGLKEYSDIEVERAVLPESLEIDEAEVGNDDAYPITVKLRHLTEGETKPAQQRDTSTSDGLFSSNLAPDDTDELIHKSKGKQGTPEIVKTKYVIGCDGAHSWTRRQLGFEMQGEATDIIWGVLDVVPITDFHIRQRCAIHSANAGSLMVIPRENRLVRLYIQLKEIVPEDGRVDRSKIMPELILSAAQKIIQPYTLTFEILDWWTAYQIGQRVGTSFDAHNRVFLAGDAVHTHSPKAGQGMNVSMQDAYNLGWKVALCLKNICNRSILKTYQSERRQVAHDLIEFDHKFSRLFSGRPAKDVMDETGVSMEEFKDAFQKGHMFASGLSVDYTASVLVAKDGHPASQGGGDAMINHHIRVVGKQALAANIRLGMRFPSFQVLNQADARPLPFQQRLTSDGRFRIVLFAGNIADAAQRTRMNNFCARLDAASSFLRRVTPPGKPIDSVIEILTLHAAPRCDVELLRDFPALLRPFDGKLGYAYDKVFVDDGSYHSGHGMAYENYGVDPRRGCVVAVRPDQYVGYISELEDVEALGIYFEGILVPEPS